MSNDFAAFARTYSTAVLPFRLEGSTHGAVGAPTPSREDVDAAVAATVRTVQRRGASRVWVLGSGHEDFSGLLANALPIPVVVSELDMDVARRVAPAHPGLLADTSMWAHALAGAHAGWAGDKTCCVLINPLLTPMAKQTYRPLFKLLTQAPLPAPATTGDQSLCIGAILHPDEPRLDEFFAMLAALEPDEVVIVWDAPALDATPGARYPQARHVARPLGKDFAAQRTRLLGECQSDWLLMLDGDERMASSLAPVLRRWMASDCAGFYLPRATLFPDAEHAKVGYGLWPDLQFRLLRMNDGVGFCGSVHERATGIHGPCGVVVDAGIAHHSRLLKKRTVIEAKLATFDAAAAHGGVSHRLAPEYPHLPLAALPPLAGAGRYLRLEHYAG